MLGIDKFSLFLISSLVLCVIPGVDMIFILGKTLTSRGWLAPILSVFGITLGLAVHSCLVAFGVGIFIAHSPLAFNLIRGCGALYLAYLGVGALRSEGSIIEIAETSSERSTNLARHFWQGMGVNLLNPKVILFFLSYLPQFIAQDCASPEVSLLLLGGTFCLIGTVWNLFLVFAGNLIRRSFLANASRMLWVNRIAGCIFVLLAVQIFVEMLKANF